MEGEKGEEEDVGSHTEVHQQRRDIEKSGTGPSRDDIHVGLHPRAVPSLSKERCLAAGSFCLRGESYTFVCGCGRLRFSQVAPGGNRLRTFLKQHWFLLCLSVVVIFGFVNPRMGLAWRQMGAVPLSVTFLMFLSGLLLDTSAFIREATNYRLIISVFACVFVIFPLLACGAARVFWAGDSEILIALLILAAQPSTLASAIVMTRIAEGNDALAVVSTVTTNLSSVVLTPLVFSVVLGVEGQIGISAQDMILRLLRIVLLPVVIGQLLRPLLSRERLTALRGPSGVMSQLVILGMILTGVSGASGQLAGSLQLVAAAFFLHIVMLGITYSLSRILKASRGESIALVLCGSQKTLPAGIYIWSTYFAHVATGCVAIVAYHIVQMIVDSVLAVRLREWRKVV